MNATLMIISECHSLPIFYLPQCRLQCLTVCIVQQKTLSVSQISQRQTRSHFPGERHFQNPITLSFQTMSQSLRASARTGGTNQTVVHRLKEHTAFFSLWGFMNSKGYFIWSFFCCLMLNIFQTYPSDLHRSFSLSTYRMLWLFIGSTFGAHLSVNGDLQI